MSSNSQPGQRLLKLRDAAHYLSMSVAFVRRLAKSGKLPFVQTTANSTILIDTADLDAWVHKTKVGGSASSTGASSKSANAIPGDTCVLASLSNLKPKGRKLGKSEKPEKVSSSLRKSCKDVEGRSSLREDGKGHQPLSRKSRRPDQTHQGNRFHDVDARLQERAGQSGSAATSQADAEHRCGSEGSFQKGHRQEGGGRMKQRPRGEGSLYQRGNTWWIAYYDHGKLLRESARTEDEQEAKALLRKRLDMLQVGTVDTLNTTVSQLVDMVLLDYKVNGRSTLDDVTTRWTLHLMPQFGNLKANEVTSSRIQLYVESRQAEQAKNATINRELALLKRAFTMGYESDPQLVLRVPKFQMLKENNVRKGFLDDDGYTRLAAATAKRGLWLRAIFETGYVLGWRRAEIEGLKVSQVDLIHRCIRLEPGETKNDEGRVGIMPDRLYHLIAACVQGKKKTDWVFTREDGKRISDFRDSWANACVEAGVSRRLCKTCQKEVDADLFCSTCDRTVFKKETKPVGLLVHDLRRTGARNLIRAGGSQNSAMAVTGHKTAEVFRRYAIVDERDVRELMQKVEVMQKAQPTVNENSVVVPN